MTSWAATVRLLVVAAVLVGLVTTVLLVLPIDLRVGPVQITRRPTE